MKAITLVSFRIIVVCLFLFSCNGGADYSDTPTTGTINIIADETLKPIIDAEIDVFQAIYHYAHINVTYKTETEALNDLLKDTTRLIITSRRLTSKEHEFFQEKKFFPQELLIAIDGIALVVNKSNKDTLLTTQQLRGILQGKITEWKQINPKSGYGGLRLIFDNNNSSTLRFMRDSILDGNTVNSNNTAMRSNLEVIDYIKSNKNVIGVIGVSWISDRDDSIVRAFLKDVNIIALSKATKAVYENSYQPYQGYMALNKYPLTRNIYVINSEPRKGLATGFAAFLASERGQRIILKSGILPATQPYRIIEIKEDL